MMRASRVWMVLGLSFAVPAIAGTIEPASYEGRAAIRLDGAGRVVVSLDRDGDGFTDRLFLFAPSGPVPPGWLPDEFDAAVEIRDASLRVSSPDGARHLRLLVAEPEPGVAPSSESGGFLVLRGVALAVHDRTGLRETLWSLASDEIDLLLPAGSDCGGTDIDCSGGGIGSTGCETQCGGGGVSTPIIGMDLEARRCGVTCAEGYFSCCRCDAGGPTCKCRGISTISECPSTPLDSTSPM